MHLRSIPLIAALIVAGARAGAQDVRIEVFEAGTGKPIVGANVSLYDSAGTIPFGGGFSDQGGRADLRGPGRGSYRLKADKVGYDTWTSVQLVLGEKTVLVRAAMAPSRTPAPLVARNETACQQLTGAGTAAGDLWVEIKKALTASALTEAQGLVPLDVDVYERVLDRNLGIVAEHVEQRPRISRRPALGISWDQVDTARRGDAASNDVYRTPDAATLLSDQFVKSHCYAAIRGYGAETGLTGLEFKPARVAGLPELTGVLWLDPRVNTLRSLNFDYVNLPIPLRVARTSGRVEFQQLPSGQWIVPRWYIRMPRVGRVVANDPRSPARDSLLGYQEVGGASRPAGSTPTARNASAGAGENLTGVDSPSESQSVIVGVVFDSTSSRALGDVQISARGKYRTLTNSGGRYELAIDGPVNDTLVFEHPRLRLFHIAERVQVISLPAGGRGQASVLVPSYATLRGRLCGRNEMGTEAQGLMAGYVTDASGKPIAGAHVWASWQITWVEQNGRLVSTNQQRTVEANTNSDGSYLMCGLTRGAQITAKVGLARRSTLEEQLVVPPSLVLEHDFRFGAR
ncbi:MAG TPA: carboxypeptidase-like regulatory domain-containing protein [Gemmatimonadaceae bacterium]|nr:carboxypeptidase-like regulatory domain-containing protein [Gemmatimonadaceae bacterium]